MKKVIFSFITLAFCHANAQNTPGKVGINTSAPKATVDVNGAIRLAHNNEEEAISPKSGTIRWNGDKRCFESHDGSEWRCYQREFGTFTTLVDVKLAENKNYKWSESWSEREAITFTEVIKNELNNETGNPIYNTSDGTLTIPENGLYEVNFKVPLALNKGRSGEFDGKSVYYSFFITKQSGNKVFSREHLVLGGLKSGDNEKIYYPPEHGNISEILLLDKGDVLKTHIQVYKVIYKDRFGNAELAPKYSYLRLHRIR